MEGFEEGEADLPFVVGWGRCLEAGGGESALAVAGEFGDEEGEIVFPGGEDLVEVCVSW